MGSGLSTNHLTKGSNNKALTTYVLDEDTTDVEYGEWTDLVDYTEPTCPECVYDPTTCGNMPNHTLVDTVTYEEMKEQLQILTEPGNDTEGFVFKRNNQQQLLLFLLLILGGVYLYQKQQNQPIDIRIYIGIIVMYYILIQMC
jgi:hypothetical protein